MTDNSQNGTSSIPPKLFLFSLGLVIVGSFLVIVGSVLSVPTNNSDGVLIVLLGPIPIIFGKSENVFSILLFAVLLAIASIIFFLLARRRE